MNLHIFGKNSSLSMLKALIVDDETHMRQTIRRMVKDYCPELEVVGEAEGVASGIEKIKSLHPDLVFLDIKMEDGTGFDLLERLSPVDFKVIFITAWDNYAIQAFKFSALDYLLKPLDPDDLLNAVDKARSLIQKDFNTQLENLHEHIESQDKKGKKIIIRNSDSIFLLNVSDILYCESDTNYTKVHVADNKEIIVSNTLKDYEEMLSDFGFFRAHKSFLINMKHISRFDKAEGGSVILDDGTKIPVASRRKDMLLEMFDRLTDM